MPSTQSSAKHSSIRERRRILALGGRRAAGGAAGGARGGRSAGRRSGKTRQRAAGGAQRPAGSGGPAARSGSKGRPIDVEGRGARGAGPRLHGSGAPPTARPREWQVAVSEACTRVPEDLEWSEPSLQRSLWPGVHLIYYLGSSGLLDFYFSFFFFFKVQGFIL